ncbi:hypothetical protein AAZX31_19G173200 [Glycine max]
MSSRAAIAVYHCILLRYFVRPQRTQRRNNSTRRSLIKNNERDQNECSICLGQWPDGDVVGLLPSCSHAFHRPWFMDHANCPTCDCELALPIENLGNEQRVLHVHGDSLMNNDDVSSTPRFQRPRPMMLHTHSLSSHMRRKRRSLKSHLDHMYSVLMRSFLQFRNSTTASGRYNAILPN